MKYLYIIISVLIIIISIIKNKLIPVDTIDIKIEPILPNLNPKKNITKKDKKDKKTDNIGKTKIKLIR